MDGDDAVYFRIRTQWSGHGRDGANVSENGGYIILSYFYMKADVRNGFALDQRCGSSRIFFFAHKRDTAFKVLDRTHPFEEEVHVLRFGVDD